MGNGRERNKRETFMEKKHPKWIDAIKEEDFYSAFIFRLNCFKRQLYEIVKDTFEKNHCCPK